MLTVLSQLKDETFQEQKSMGTWMPQRNLNFIIPFLVLYFGVIMKKMEKYRKKIRYIRSIVLWVNIIKKTIFLYLYTES